MHLRLVEPHFKPCGSTFVHICIQRQSLASLLPFAPAPHPFHARYSHMEASQYIHCVARAIRMLVAVPLPCTCPVVVARSRSRRRFGHVLPAHAVVDSETMHSNRNKSHGSGLIEGQNLPIACPVIKYKLKRDRIPVVVCLLLDPNERARASRWRYSVVTGT